MANNYCQWSQVIPRLTEDEEAWLKVELELDPEYMEEKELDAFLKDRGLAEFGGSWPGFDWKLDDDSHWGRHLWVFAEESGDLDALASIVGRFLGKFRPDDYFAVSWADTCSKMRVGEFGGGAMIVRANRVEGTSSYQWIDNAKLANWNRNDLQFPRLLAEINAVGLTEEQYAALSESMDIAREDIDDILARAEMEWQKIKEWT